MINSKKLIEMARKWQKMAGIRRRRVSLSLPKARDGLADKGHFVVYSTDQRRFVVPLPCLRNNIFRELFTMSEEEFGLPRNGPITLPLDAASLEYVVSVVQGCISKEIEKSLASTLHSEITSVSEGPNCRQITIHGF